MGTNNMNLQQILDANKQINPLYDFVNSHCSVEFKKREDKTEAWGSTIQSISGKDSAIIFWCPTKHPQAALTHELLHFKNQILGYKRIRMGVAIDDSGLNCNLKYVGEAIDNEFQYQKNVFRIYFIRF